MTARDQRRRTITDGDNAAFTTQTLGMELQPLFNCRSRATGEVVLLAGIVGEVVEQGRAGLREGALDLLAAPYNAFKQKIIDISIKFF